MNWQDTEIETVSLARVEMAATGEDGPSGRAESWVQLLPSGKFDLNDKRGPWVVKDMASIIARSQATLERGMVVDFDHAAERGHLEKNSAAAGWIEELDAREDGIWARIAWSATGRARIEGRDYRFISPVVMVSKAGEVMAIRRAGLTNDPAIAMKAICSVQDDGADDAPVKAPEPASETTPDKADVIAMLREALGAAPDASIEELIKRARAILSAAETTRTENAAAKALASGYMGLLSEVHEGRVEAALERARSSGKLVPAMEDWAQELASNNLEGFERWEAAAQPMINLAGPRLAGRTPPPELLERGRFKGSSERQAICSQLGLAPDQIEE